MHLDRGKMIMQQSDRSEAAIQQLAPPGPLATTFRADKTADMSNWLEFR